MVIGLSGSGKSTFLRCLNFLETPTGGEIYFEGKSPKKPAELQEHRKNMGMVFQHFNLFPHLTVLQNVTLAAIEARKQENKQNKLKIPKKQIVEEERERALKLLTRIGLDRKSVV